MGEPDTIISTEQPLREQCVALLLAPAEIRAQYPALVDQYGSLAAAITQCSPFRRALGGVDPKTLDAHLRWLELPGHHILAAGVAGWPALLDAIAGPPPALLIAGDPLALQRPQLAMVGSRNPTAAGVENAAAFAAHLARRGLAICSGLAAGIDTAAHRGALAAGGQTVAVCGTGLDQVYPAQNEALAAAISEQGALVSEFPLGTPPRRDHFPRRNRIISGLSVGTLVVEAARRSGSLITARLASEQGREVFAIPGSIHNPLSRGCHALIRQGAKLVESADDIMSELSALFGALEQSLDVPEKQVQTAAAGPAGEDDSDYNQLLNVLGHDPVNLDTLVNRSGLTPDAVSSMLLILELQGRVQPVPGGCYVRSERGD